MDVKSLNDLVFVLEKIDAYDFTRLRDDKCNMR